MVNRQKYSGPERRIHKVYVTRNTEYHVRRGVCVAVKPRQDAEWIASHHALNMKVEGHVKVGALLPIVGMPKIGYRIYFATDNEDVLTSPVVAIVRPAQNIVEQYPEE
jgi:hypothetical protein